MASSLLRSGHLNHFLYAGFSSNTFTPSFLRCTQRDARNKWTAAPVTVLNFTKSPSQRQNSDTLCANLWAGRHATPAAFAEVAVRHTKRVICFAVSAPLRDGNTKAGSREEVENGKWVLLRMFIWNKKQWGFKWLCWEKEAFHWFVVGVTRASVAAPSAGTFAYCWWPSWDEFVWLCQHVLCHLETELCDFQAGQLHIRPIRFQWICRLSLPFQSVWHSRFLWVKGKQKDNQKEKAFLPLYLHFVSLFLSFFLSKQ